MSLFKSRELWSTQCGGKDELYDNGCLVTADVLTLGFDCIATGSHSGFLRIFQPQLDSESDASGYRPTDLLIETQLAYPVLQLAFGKLVSGSQNLQLGVLHPCSVAVYCLVAVSGSAQHGDQYHLSLAYEHQLSRSAFSFVVGPFGGVKGRDFICTLSLDGCLSFFEQETFAGSRSLPCFLLPSPFTYVPTSDCFIVHNANWVLECYRYDVLADSNRKLLPWWALNLGEDIVDIQVVITPGSKAAILVLGENNLYCIKEGGSVDLVKRLQFKPCSFHTFFVESDHRVMVLIVADTATLLVHDLTALCWSSQLPFVPVVVSRVNFKGVRGVIALLSDDGQIVCCYLGTEPGVFVAPPLSNRAYSYNDLQQKLLTLQQEIDSASQMAAMQVNESHELTVSWRTLALSDPSECQLLVSLAASSVLSSVQVTISINPPLTLAPSVHHIPSLCDEVEISSLVTWLPTHAVPQLTTDVHIVAVYTGRLGSLRTVQVTAVLPATMVLHPVPPTKDAEHKITLALSQPPIPLNILFSDMQGEDWESAGCTETVMALSHRSVPGVPNSIVMSKSSSRYRIQGDNLAAMCLVVTQLVSRLEAHYASRHLTFSISNIGNSLPFSPLLVAVDKHVLLRNNFNVLQERLGQETTQYRAIQRRLLSKLREKTVQPLVGLDKLLTDTHKLIVQTSNSIQDTLLELEICSSELGCLVRMVLVLVKLCDTTTLKDWTDLAAAMSYVLHSAETQGWEEVCEAGVNYLLSTSLAKSVRDHQRTSVDPFKDTQRFKKHLTVALDRVMAGTSSRIIEEPRGVSPITESEEDHLSNLSRRNSMDIRANLTPLRLLPARKALQNYDELRKLADGVSKQSEDEAVWC